MIIIQYLHITKYILNLIVCSRLTFLSDTVGKTQSQDCSHNLKISIFYYVYIAPLAVEMPSWALFYYVYIFKC